jgi:hypothetical protein
MTGGHYLSPLAAIRRQGRDRNPNGRPTRRIVLDLGPHKDRKNPETRIASLTSSNFLGPV